MSCAQVHAHARFAEHQADWNREYRRIYARKLRGTITESDWRAWVNDASRLRPNLVLSFDTWWVIPPNRRRELLEPLEPKIGDPAAFLEELRRLWSEPVDGEDAP
jgi:hypothetical protein